MEAKSKRKIIFITGTRADFGKLKSLMNKVRSDTNFDLHIFVTGMHMLSKYGYTCEEVERAGFANIYKFVNQNTDDAMDQILSKTITGFSDYVREIKPDLIVVHGDRLEAMAGALVGAFNNILVAHIEGGEVSGTVDELIRHAVTKLTQVHFVANDLAKNRLIQLGENEDLVYVIGSPDIDLMNSSKLPFINDVKDHYDFNFENYGILLFHPVTTEIEKIKFQARIIVDEVLASKLNFIVIYPNNDPGSNIILEEYKRFRNVSRIRMYPSMRFEYFLTTLKNANLMIGNSSAGVREAPYYAIPSINLGSRQHNRVICSSVINADIKKEEISSAINLALKMKAVSNQSFGIGDSDQRFYSVISSEDFWVAKVQKHFIDQKIVSAG